MIGVLTRILILILSTEIYILEFYTEKNRNRLEHIYDKTHLYNQSPALLFAWLGWVTGCQAGWVFLVKLAPRRPTQV